MKQQVKKFLKDWLPPKILQMVQASFGKYGYSGDYKMWEEAKGHCTGYDHSPIVEKVLQAALKVKRGEAAFERDSLLYLFNEYSSPLLGGLLRAVCLNHNRLHVLDFGGSLGSSYYQHKLLFPKNLNLRWCVVEQEDFVRYGKKYFEDSELVFYDSLERCLRDEQLDAVILSSVLPYLENPHAVLEKILGYGIRHIIIDRTPFLSEGASDRLTVQRVPPSIYPASYPAWFFNKRKFLRHFDGQYKLIAEFKTNDKANIKSEFLALIFDKI